MTENEVANVSKMEIDEKELKADTIPNPVLTGGWQEIGLNKINPIDIPKYLLMHPALPRGIELKANRMIRLVDGDLERNIVPNKSGHAKAAEAAEYCRKILANSDGPLFLKKFCMGAYRFGTSFAMLQTNKKETEVLKFEYQHEIFFGPAKYPFANLSSGWDGIPVGERNMLMGKMKINPKTKKIAKYTQLTRKYPQRSEDNFKTDLQEYVNTRTNPDLKAVSPGELTPVGEEIDERYVIQLAFDTIGDEPLGISLVQFLQLTLTYLLNMEKGGAQSQVNFGFNKWVANTPFKDQTKMRLFAQSLSKINTDAVVILPENIDLKNIAPGTTDFDKVHPIYMQLIAIRLGIPMPLLMLETSTNRSTIEEQRKDMYDDFVADELVIEQSIRDGFFKACRIKYPDLSVKELDAVVPRFVFNQPPEDLDTETERNLKFSLTLRNYANVAQIFAEIGDLDTSAAVAGRVRYLLHKKGLSPGGFDEAVVVTTSKNNMLGFSQQNQKALPAPKKSKDKTDSTEKV